MAADAAEEVARLQAENERLRAVLEGKTVMCDADARFIQRGKGEA